MKKRNIRDILVILIPKGYTIDEMLDLDDENRQIRFDGYACVR